MKDQPAIKTTGLTRKFGDFTAVDHISFEVAQGEIFGFLGANGAGKTTAIRMLCGLLKATEGAATVAGFDINKEPEKVKKNIGYMSQKFSLYDDLTIFQNIRFYGGIYGLSAKNIKDKAENALRRLGLYEERNTLVGSLPLGWKQKLAFTTAALHDPRVIFLDEPTSGVDPVARRQFWRLIYETAHEGVAIFVTTHYMEESEYCDRVSIMVDGKIKALDRPGSLKSTYGVKTMNDVFLTLTR